MTLMNDEKFHGNRSARFWEIRKTDTQTDRRGSFIYRDRRQTPTNDDDRRLWPLLVWPPVGGPATRYAATPRHFRPNQIFRSVNETECDSELFYAYMCLTFSDLVRHDYNRVFFIEFTPINMNNRRMYDPTLYRVAQNKIPHQTICNISATSGLILKILEAA